MPFEFVPMKIEGVVLIKPRVFSDARGYFQEKYHKSAFRESGLVMEFVQDNHSHSRKGVLRGLHYQLNPKPQGKLVSVIRGEIFDVGVDIRQGSPTYGQYVGEILSQENHHLLYLPEGFAHGFIVLSEHADVIYKVTHEFTPALDRGILWNDPDLKIEWPVSDPLLSEKDRNLPILADCENNFVYMDKE